MLFGNLALSFFVGVICVGLGMMWRFSTERLHPGFDLGRDFAGAGTVGFLGIVTIYALKGALS